MCGEKSKRVLQQIICIYLIKQNKKDYLLWLQDAHTQIRTPKNKLSHKDVIVLQYDTR